jgi:anthranilate phosphoribosyltransferase
MSISHYIKEIGRGSQGARSLSREQAYDLMSQVLDGQVTDLELGAFAIAMRIKGESVPELTGFLQATTERCLPLTSTRAVVLLPSYNGARKLPNLTPLLALLLARAGLHVLVHGLGQDPGRVTSLQIFQALNLPVATDVQGITQAWQQGQPAYIEAHHLCPALARLLDARWVIGLRNPAHTVAKLLSPVQEEGRSLRVVNYTPSRIRPATHRFFANHPSQRSAHARHRRRTSGRPTPQP